MYSTIKGFTIVDIGENVLMIIEFIGNIIKILMDISN